MRSVVSVVVVVVVDIHVFLWVLHACVYVFILDELYIHVYMHGYFLCIKRWFAFSSCLADVVLCFFHVHR